MSDVHHYHGTVWAVVMVCLYRRIWQGVCSPISCHKTESAQELFQTPDCSERSESAAFPHSVRWHIVTDSSLIIPRQWRYTCQSLQIAMRRGWSRIPLAPCNVFRSDGIMSDWRFNLDARWREPDPELPRLPLIARPAVPLHYPPKKNTNHGANTENIKRLLIAVARRTFPCATRSSVAPSRSSVAVFLNIHDEVALWFRCWISNCAVKRDTTCP